MNGAGGHWGKNGSFGTRSGESFKQKCTPLTAQSEPLKYGIGLKPR